MKLEARKISFRYSEKEREIWKDFSLEIDSGERVGLSAPSGFGKTTLCKILAGHLLTRPFFNYLCEFFNSHAFAA